MKRCFALAVLILWLIAMPMPVMANTDSKEVPYNCLQVIDSTSFYDENGNIQYFCMDCTQSRHAHFSVHSHQITNVSSPVRYSEYGGILAETEYPAEKDGTLGGSLTKSVSNTYSVSIGFSADTISNSVGYDVTSTWSSTAERTIDVAKGEMAQILYYDVYAKTNFTAITYYYEILDNGELRLLATESADGYSLEWKNFSYSDNVYVP